MVALYSMIIIIVLYLSYIEYTQSVIYRILYLPISLLSENRLLTL